MKLESLNSSKFDAFKGNEIQETFNIFGGAPVSTTYKSGASSGADCLDYGTRDGSYTTNLDGSNRRECDYNRGVCKEVSAVRMEPVVCTSERLLDHVEFDYNG